MYIELGGYLGYRRTPLRELQEVRLSILAELNEQVRQEAALQEERAKLARQQS